MCSIFSKELKEKLSISVSSVNLTEVKEHLESEVKHLKQQLKWYMENQQLIDNNIEALQKKDKEIALLKEKLSKKVQLRTIHCHVRITYIDLNPYASTQCNCLTFQRHIRVVCDMVQILLYFR